MKNIMMFIVILTLSYSSQATELTADIALEAVKSDDKIITFLADKSPADYKITYQQLKIGGLCGFVGCNWRQLVSVIITAKSSNNPSKTILLLVEGLSSSIDSKPTVSFISIKSNIDNELTFID